VKTLQRRVIIGIIGTAVGAAGWLAAVGPVANSQEPPADQLTGQAYADSLGLELQDQQPQGCNDWFTVQGETGWCLDRIDGDTTVDAWNVGERLRGHIPTDTDIQIFALRDEIGDLSDSPEDQQTRSELSAQLLQLESARDAGNPATPATGS
jgi:hypothetical protein